MKRFGSAASLLLATAGLAGCAFGGGGIGTGAIETSPAPSTWPGPPQPGKDGSVSVQRFNDYVQTLPPSKRGGPKELAVAFLKLRGGTSVVSMETRPGGSTVTVTEDNLEDDSVRARRHVLSFALVSGGRVLLMDARVTYRCHANRGHKQFSARLCV